MKNSNYFLVTFVMLVLCACDGKNQPTQTGEQKTPIDLIGTTWIYLDGVVSTAGKIDYYLYREAVILNNNEISSEVWSSEKELNLSSVTDLFASGCKWYYIDAKATYTYDYPSVFVSYKDNMIGKATIATDNKSATMNPVDATLKPFNIIKMDAVKDFTNDPWAATVWDKSSQTISMLTLGNYNQLAHIYTSYAGSISVKYEYKQVGNEYLPFFDLTHIEPGSATAPEPIDYYKYTYAGHLENLPSLGYRFILTIHNYIKYTRYSSETEILCETDTLKQITFK